MRQKRTLHLRYHTSGNLRLLEQQLTAPEKTESHETDGRKRRYKPSLLTHQLQFSPGGFRCDWADEHGTPQATLLHPRKLPPEILYHATRTWSAFPVRPPRAQADHGRIERQLGTSKLVGETEQHAIPLDFAGFGRVTLWIETATETRFRPPCLNLWWRTLLPLQASLVEDLGLPTRIEARLPDGTTGVRIELESVQEEPYQARDFERPADYRHPAGDRRPLQKPRRNGDGLPTPDIVRRALDEDDAAPARAGERLFALMPDEDVKVLFSDTLITRAIDPSTTSLVIWASSPGSDLSSRRTGGRIRWKRTHRGRRTLQIVLSCRQR